MPIQKGRAIPWIDERCEGFLRTLKGKNWTSGDPNVGFASNNSRGTNGARIITRIAFISTAEMPGRQNEGKTSAKGPKLTCCLRVVDNSYAVLYIHANL